ncbi:unnamed protein product [Rotaria sp. Silwood1]|nr:unnamed protein product [Rotaria sp. Silwood1]
MLNRILVIENLSESIKLIQIDDEERKETTHLDQDERYDEPDYADAKTLSSLIKEDIDQWYDRSDIDLKEKLESHGYVVDDINDDLNSIEDLEQIIFICTDRINAHDHRHMMQAVGRKINKHGVLRDVFIFINDAIQYFSCHLIKSVPYLTFDLRTRAAQLNDDEIREVIDYLNSKI